jgi:hypothetical protein
MRPIFLCAISLAAFVFASCESNKVDYSGLGLVDVTGKVTMDGQPSPGVTVRFEGPPNRWAEGKTDAEGKYRLMYDSNQAGCMPGEKVVRIMSGSVGEGSDEDAPAEGAAAKAPTVKSIPSVYNSASTLKADVSASNKSFNFDLKSMP